MKCKGKAIGRTHAMGSGQRGFSLLEVAIASVVLIAGAVAVMQLVPAAMQSNLNNRYDTTSAVAIQRLRDLMVNQLLVSTTLTDPKGEFPCGTTVVCSLGDSTKSDQLVGAPLLASGDIDFSANPVAGYNFIYASANDASRTPYDMRWAVVTSVRNIGSLTNVVVSKRLILGARRQGGNGTSPTSVTFVSWVSR